MKLLNKYIFAYQNESRSIEEIIVILIRWRLPKLCYELVLKLGFLLVSKYNNKL